MKSTYKVFGQFVKMSAIDKAKFKASIELFYINYKYFKAACVLTSMYLNVLCIGYANFMRG